MTTALLSYTTPLSVIAAPVFWGSMGCRFGAAEGSYVEETMSVFAALDVSQELTAVCVVNQDGSIIAEAKLATCPDAITAYLERWSGQLERVGMETGPLAVWLWNALMARDLRDWAHAIAQRTGPRKAKVALARKLAVTLHAMWRTGSVFKDSPTNSTTNAFKDTAMA